MDAPPQGYYKLNTDAACFADGMIGMGGVVRDNVGDVLVATCHKMRGSFGADISEVVAARHSLGIALDASFNRLILEYDNLKLIQHLKDERSENTPFSLIVKDILHIAHTCQHINFVHVGRKGNGVDHDLAHISKDYEEMCLWLEEAPSVVSTALAIDSTIT